MEVPEDDPNAHKPHFGPNVWPSEGKQLLNIISFQLQSVVDDHYLFWFHCCIFARYIARVEADNGGIS